MHQNQMEDMKLNDVFTFLKHLLNKHFCLAIEMKWKVKILFDSVSLIFVTVFKD